MILLQLSDWFSLFGRFHPLVVHLPIGIIVVAVLFECLGFFRRYEHLKNAVVLVWLLGAITSILSCVAGLLLAQDGGYEEEVLSQHQWAGIALALLTTLIYFLKVKRTLTPLPSLALAVVVVMILSVTGHLGGSLTHGENYLTEAVNAALGLETAEALPTVREPIANIEEAVVYKDLVMPVLEQKCYRCHSSKKQKGELRVDAIEHMIKGGEGGTALVAGDPGKSELYKRLVLPKDDKHRMPPKGKQQLTKDEILLIEWWIREAGASADKKVREVTKPQPVEVMLTSLGNNPEADETVDSEIPDVAVSEASQEAINQLESVGLHVSKLSPHFPFLSINCVNAPDFNDEHAKLLSAVQEQVLWLKAGSTQLGDKSAVTLSRLKNLTRLSLEYTNVTDKGISSLKDLQRLQYLNLVGTRVSDASIESLKACKRLKFLYLWQSRFTETGVERLREAMPGVEINFGEAHR